LAGKFNNVRGKIAPPFGRPACGNSEDKPGTREAAKKPAADKPD
jgi:hypothetical protein